MTRIPKLRRQKCKHRPDRAFVEIEGKRHFLGRWDDPRTQEAYARLILRLSNGQAPQKGSGGSVTVVELCASFLEDMTKKRFMSRFREKPAGFLGRSSHRRGIRRPCV